MMTWTDATVFYAAVLPAPRPEDNYHLPDACRLDTTGLFPPCLERWSHDEPKSTHQFNPETGALVAVHPGKSAREVWAQLEREKTAQQKPVTPKPLADKTILLRLSADLRRRIITAANRRETSVNALLRSIAVEYLDRNKIF